MNDLGGAGPMGLRRPLNFPRHGGILPRALLLGSVSCELQLQLLC
jgi:hypothetical protein